MEHASFDGLRKCFMINLEIAHDHPGIQKSNAKCDEFKSEHFWNSDVEYPPAFLWYVDQPKHCIFFPQKDRFLMQLTYQKHPRTQICFRNRFLRNAMKSMLDSNTAMLLFTRYQYQWTMTDRAPTAEGQRGFEMIWMVYGFAHYMLDFRGSSHFETWICNSEIFDTFYLLLCERIFPGFRQFGSNNGLSWVWFQITRLGGLLAASIWNSRDLVYTSVTGARALSLQCSCMLANISFL